MAERVRPRHGPERPDPRALSDGNRRREFLSPAVEHEIDRSFEGRHEERAGNMAAMVIEVVDARTERAKARAKNRAHAEELTPAAMAARLLPRAAGHDLAERAGQFRGEG